MHSCGTAGECWHCEALSLALSTFVSALVSTGLWQAQWLERGYWGARLCEGRWCLPGRPVPVVSTQPSLLPQALWSPRNPYTSTKHKVQESRRLQRPRAAAPSRGFQVSDPPHAEFRYSFVFWVLELQRSISLHLRPTTALSLTILVAVEFSLEEIPR